MVLNPYFGNFVASGEQRLLESLIIEAIQIYGQNVYYIPRTRNNFDELLGADDSSSFDRAIAIEMYVKTYEGFQGDGAFLGKFNLEIRDQVTFTVAQSRFKDTVEVNAGILRPREGDLVYFPLHDKCFEITFVDYKPFFYQLNEMQTYDLKCELFEYSGERFNTGIKAIDKIQTNLSINILDNTLYNELGQPLMNEQGKYLTNVAPDAQIEIANPLANNDDLQISGDVIVDFTEINPLTDGPY